MEKLTKDNYRTNHDYMSYSRFSRFLTCEAAAAAGYHPEPSVAQLVGSYVDAYFSDELTDFTKEHPEIFNSRTGELKTDFKQAEELIARINSDETFMEMMSGEKQVIMSGEIDNVPFKIKIDSYIKDKAIVDLKVMKDFRNVWSDAYGSMQNFVVAYNYDIEMALFQEIVRQNTGKVLPCYLACITKENPSDIGIFSIPQTDLDKALNIVKHYLPRIAKILSGEIAPHRCNKCEYCRKTKKSQIVPFDLIGANGDELREAGYTCEDEKLNVKENK